MDIIQLNQNYIDEIIEYRIAMMKTEEQVDETPELINAIRKFLEKHLNINYFQYAILNDNEIVSTAAYRIEEYLPQNHNLAGKKALIENVYTKPEHENKGHCKSLMNYLMGEIQTQGINVIELSTKNSKARTIYKNFGFYKKENVMKWSDKK